jgi:glucose-1-phosphate cytidylyltransferase
MEISNQEVKTFQEKPVGDGAWINAGFFVLEPAVFDYIEGDQTSWELKSLQGIVEQNELRAFQHHGFWLGMDTLRDKNHLEELWATGNAPWKVW